MHIRQIFSVDKVVPVDLFPVVWQILLQCYFPRCVFYGSHKFPCQTLLLSTTILNDMENWVVSAMCQKPCLLFPINLILLG